MRKGTVSRDKANKKYQIINNKCNESGVLLENGEYYERFRLLVLHLLFNIYYLVFAPFPSP